MIANTHYGYAGKSKDGFSYTGNYNMREDGVVELLTSGTITFFDARVIDLFLVGGGGGGGSATHENPGSTGYGGGGGGYTATFKNVNIAKNASFAVIVGKGGKALEDGEASKFGDQYIADGGKTAGLHQVTSAFSHRIDGGNGGSGGGGGVSANSQYGGGGSDGGNGQRGGNTVNDSYSGKGQGTTTREFGESTGKLYAGGGGGGRYMASSQPIVSTGGNGGGGTGAWGGRYNNDIQAAAAGVANTGGGGGGGATTYQGNARTPGASGGSGIVCFRVAK